MCPRSLLTAHKRCCRCMSGCGETASAAAEEAVLLLPLSSHLFLSPCLRNLEKFEYYSLQKATHYYFLAHKAGELTAFASEQFTRSPTPPLPPSAPMQSMRGSPSLIQRPPPRTEKHVPLVNRHGPSFWIHLYTHGNSFEPPPHTHILLPYPHDYGM